ncbi:Pleckstrin y domain-containing F member 2 [Globodera pallida]|nr:Pleckstrin y domain-containing F member 2 [Globodera pallida]
MVDRLRNSEANTRRIQNVEACFGSGRTLLQAGRVLVGEGSLMKMCRKKAKARMFFLFNDLMVYGSIVLSKKRYSKQHVIPLEEVKLDNLEDEGDARYGWLIKTRTKSFVVYAATQGEKEQWMSHIRRCAEELINNGKVPPSDYAALWVPDKEATKCMCCQTSHFTVIQRRHHCRACGKVVCNGCSSKSFVLEGISKKPVRVCDTCYNKLCQGMRTQPIAQAMFGGGGGQRRDSSRSIAEYGGGVRGGAVDEHAVDSSDSDMEQTEQEEEEGQREQPTFYDSAAAVVVNNNSTPPPLPQRQVEI